ncbi:MAG: tagatose 1,6-diphosphate aldolase [Dehalococcoidia bacterium]
MTQTQSRPNVQMTRGKYENLLKLSDQKGTIRAAAMDQRGSLKRAIAKARGGEATDADLTEFKAVVAEVLTPYATAILLDPEYGIDAMKRRAANAGVLLAYERTGYDATVKGRLPDLLPDWSVRRLAELGANAIKILLYYDPDDDPAITRVKQVFIERVGAECRASDIPFFLEPLAYSDAVGDEAGFDFAKVKPAKVTKYMDEFSKPQYGVDILKVEVPINMKFVEGTTANETGQVAYTREQAKEYFRTAAAATRIPFIYLSAGVTDEVFRETLELAAEAATPFAGVLCGRATWQDGIPEYATKGVPGLRAWLEDRGVQNIEALNRVLEKGAHAWWDFYGGKDNIKVVGP